MQNQIRNHLEKDVFGKSCARVLNTDNRGRNIVYCDDGAWAGNTMYAPTPGTYPGLTEVLKKYSLSSDGSLNVLVKVCWYGEDVNVNGRISGRTEVYLLKMDPEYMNKMLEILNFEKSELENDNRVGYVVSILTLDEVSEDTVVYDQIEFMNEFMFNYFGFEFIRPDRTKIDMSALRSREN